MSPTVAMILTLLAYLCLGVVAVAVASVIGHSIRGLLERRHYDHDPRRPRSPKESVGESTSMVYGDDDTRGDRATELRQSTRTSQTSRAGSRARAERPGESPPGSREGSAVRAGRGAVTDDGVGLERTQGQAHGRDPLGEVMPSAAPTDLHLLRVCSSTGVPVSGVASATPSYRDGIEWRMVAWTVDALYNDLA